MDLTIIETVELIEWCEIYAKDLLKFGVKDDSLNNGIRTLRCGYARKIHIQITPLMHNIVRNERQLDPDIDEKGYFCTSGPKDFHRIFSEMLEVPIAKRMKDLALEVIGVLKQITLQFQRLLHILIKVSTHDSQACCRTTRRSEGAF